MNKKVAEKIRDEVLKALDTRKGFDYWWDNIDEDVQDEISSDLDQVIKDVLDDNFNEDT